MRSKHRTSAALPVGRAWRLPRPRQVQPLALLFFVLIATLVAACQESPSAEGDSAWELAVSFEPNPPLVGAATATFQITTSDGEPVEQADVKLEANMNHAGMTPVFAAAEPLGGGRYVAQFEFTMGGDWFLLVEATTPDGRSHDWKEDVLGVASK